MSTKVYRLQFSETLRHQRCQVQSSG